MPVIRNSSLIKKFTDFFRLKVGDGLDSDASQRIIPTVNMPLPKRITVIQDTTLNDSDKTFTVPSGKQWKLLYGHVFLATSADAGNRRMRFSITDGTNVIYDLRALNVQVASTTERYNLGQFNDVTESVATAHNLPIPNEFILDAGFTVRLVDVAAIAATADDMDVFLIVEEIDTTGEGF